MYQEWIIEKQEDFNIKDILECGQCFRWEKIGEQNYRIIVRKNVMQIEQIEKKIHFKMQGEEEIEKLCTYYFDLETNYKPIKEKLAKIDENMQKSITYGSGIRILNQDLWETIISFIISANNNIPRIKGIIERLSKTYGTPITYQRETYYAFPSPEQLAKATIEDLRKLGLGFRDSRVYETTNKIINKQVDLEELEKEKDSQKVRESLMALPGVGPKVADCILLFSTLKRWEVFPMDVWIRRVINELYIQKDEKKVTRKQVEEIAQKKFGNLAGIAQQYLFYWRSHSGEVRSSTGGKG